MCIILTRNFACVKDGSRITHAYQYLHRCANPVYEYCIAGGARITSEEFYDISCHVCAGKFVHPSTPPVRITRSPPNEENDDARRAAISYARHLSDLVSMSAIERWPRVANAEDGRHELIKGTSRLELACRFNKDHCSIGPYCGCAEANTHPEFHNISAAVRSVVCRTYYYPMEDARTAEEYEWSRVPISWAGESNKLEKNVREYYTDRVVRQPDLGVLAPLKTPRTVNDIEVIPFQEEGWDHRTRNAAMMQHVDAAVSRHRGRWQDLGHPMFDEGQEIEFDYCLTLNKIVARLLSVDSGLSLERALAILTLFTVLLDLDSNTNLKEAWPDLAHLTDPIDTEFSTIGGVLSIFYGCASTFCKPFIDMNDIPGLLLSVDDKFQRTNFLLYLNRQMRIHDENARASAVESAVTPLTKQEVDALADGAEDCIICAEPMRYPSEAHAAVRLHCDAGHVIGMNCFMEACRRKRLTYVSQEEGLVCPFDRCKIGEWGPPVYTNTITAASLM